MDFRKFFTAVDKSTGTVQVSGLRGGGSAMLAARTAEALNRPVFCIIPSEAQASVLEQDLRFFTDLPILYYPGYDIPPYTPLSPDPNTVAQRISCLHQLINSSGPLLVICSIEALHRRVLPRNILVDMAELLIAEEEVKQHELAQKLTASGYELVSQVHSLGEFSIRGGIMDIFPPPFSTPGSNPDDNAGQASPIRLDFFGDLIESIHFFDPITQRSQTGLQEAVLLPVSDTLWPTGDRLDDMLEHFLKIFSREDSDKDEIFERLRNQQSFPGIEFFLPLFYEKTATLLDYLPPATIHFVFDTMETDKYAALVRERINTNFAAKNGAALPPDQLFISEQELAAADRNFPVVNFHDFTVTHHEQDDALSETHEFSSANHKLLKQEIELHRKRRGLLAPLADAINTWLQAGEKVVFACRSTRHSTNLAEMLSRFDIETAVIEQAADTIIFAQPDRHRGKVLVVDRPLSEGFDLDGLHLLSEIELFDAPKLASQKKKLARKDQLARFEELRSGDIVVHKDHGLGIYQGLANLELQAITNDFMLIEYQDGDRLYVPVDRISIVSKYKGISDKTPKLDRLGGKAWITAKNKVKEAVWQVAGDLLDLYAHRKIMKGQSFSPPDDLYKELEESFPYDETHGQTKAINEILADLTSEQTMDRLVCGDVGFGKTEVAVRAAFKVICDNLQVAVFVPTTVLAEQHLKTFTARLRGFPVRIASLNRFRSRAEQKEILADLAAGRIDIVIGTHRLLSQDVHFKELGLLIIDEEHRFGVSHKEKLKKLRHQVDVLTLTATPIPRTLQLSLLGVRDLSVIDTPPPDRRTIKTFIAKYDDLVIKEAIIRELVRGGQVFLVHNRVQSIHEIARKVNKLVPQARVAVAHGQMPGKNLEEIMVQFVNKKIDVLICTTIVESGLDIPSANTIIITRADRLGLAEIYQLRGRVGRSEQQAYAYLLVPSLDGMSKDARRRLRALMDYNELGGGFKLAMSDLQIRGGGNILGKSQSGNIAAVGYDLYLDLLQKTVISLKRQNALEQPEELEEIDPEILLNISAYIPKTYIADTDQRYLLYRRICSLADPEAIGDMQNELRERFGIIPEEVDNLLAVVTLRLDLKKLRVTKLERGPSCLILSFDDKTPVLPERIMVLIAGNPRRYRFTPDSRLICQTDSNPSPAEIFRQSHALLANFL